MTWQQEEADRYDWLYRDKGYTPGNPMAIVKQFGYTQVPVTIDLGCGHAIPSTYFERYIGVDVSPHIISQNKRLKDGEYHCSSLDRLPDQVLSGIYDIALCADVMEHIPPNKIDVVLSSISQLNSRFWAFSICTRDSAWKGPSGESLHPTVRNAFWWEDKLAHYFSINRKHVAGDNAMFEYTRL